MNEAFRTKLHVKSTAGADFHERHIKNILNLFKALKVFTLILYEYLPIIFKISRKARTF
jgi:hypothetical protein